MSSRFKHFLIEGVWLLYKGVIAGVVTYIGYKLLGLW